MSGAAGDAGPELDAAQWERFAGHAASLGAALSPSQLSSLRSYLALLCEWNRRFNLTAIERPEEILVKHFLDSLTTASMVDFERVKTVIDVGAGAGFPGLVLKIAYPHLEVALLDSLRKRLGFLERVVEVLGLRGVQTVHARAEDAARPPARAESSSLRERFDLVTARAVARLNVLAEWTLPFARVGGQVLAMKGPEVEGELAEARPAIELLGGGRPCVRQLQLPEVDAGRSLVLIPKERRTPRGYPRLAGSARRHPL